MPLEKYKGQPENTVYPLCLLKPEGIAWVF
jgi:hypothetical protein